MKRRANRWAAGLLLPAALPLLYLRTQITLPVAFAQIAGTYDPNWNLRAAAAIITALAPLAVFVLLAIVCAILIAAR